MLHDPVLERVEGNHRDPAAGREQVERFVERLPQRVQFAVDRDADRLEGLAGGMPRLPAHLGRYPHLDKLGQRILERLAIETAERKDTSYSGNSSAASLEAE